MELLIIFMILKCFPAVRRAWMGHVQAVMPDRKWHLSGWNTHYLSTINTNHKVTRNTPRQSSRSCMKTDLRGSSRCLISGPKIYIFILAFHFDPLRHRVVFDAKSKSAPHCSDFRLPPLICELRRKVISFITQWQFCSRWELALNKRVSEGVTGQAGLDLVLREL